LNKTRAKEAYKNWLGYWDCKVASYKIQDTQQDIRIEFCDKCILWIRPGILQIVQGLWYSRLKTPPQYDWPLYCGQNKAKEEQICLYKGAWIRHHFLQMMSQCEVIFVKKITHTNTNTSECNV
jgi:hypothetical protein